LGDRAINQVQEQIEQDLKAAMLSGDKATAETLRGLKSAILNEAISAGAQDSGLNDQQLQKVLLREAKKRTEAAQFYQTGGSQERAEKELSEKTLIDKYLPEQLSEDKVKKIVDQELAKLDSPGMKDLGMLIGAVKKATQGRAEGATIAKLVKESLAE
jgi:uncharacterized protein